MAPRMSAGAAAAARDEEGRAARKAAYLAMFADTRARHHTRLAAMKQCLPSLAADAAEAVARCRMCQEASTREGAPEGHSDFGEGRGAPGAYGRLFGTHGGVPDAGAGGVPEVNKRAPRGRRDTTGACRGSTDVNIEDCCGSPAPGGAGRGTSRARRPARSAGWPCC
jgi:hypothetical protein